MQGGNQENRYFNLFLPSLPSPADMLHLGYPHWKLEAREPAEAICPGQPPGGQTGWRRMENGSCEQTEDIQHIYTDEQALPSGLLFMCL